MYAYLLFILTHIWRQVYGINTLVCLYPIAVIWG